MSFILELAFLFFVGSIIGWVIELFFRRFFASDNSQKKWVNPGFLIGPYLPLYGFGMCVMWLLSGLEKYCLFKNEIANKIILFALMAICMTILEYIAGLIFIKKMKVKLWDYTGIPGNIQGIICPRFSLFWAALGAIYYFLIHPYVTGAILWLSENLAFSFFIGFFFGIFIIDVVYSAKLMSKIKSFAEEKQIVIRYEELKKSILASKEKGNERFKFIFMFRSSKPISDHLKQYFEEYKIKLEEQKKKLTEAVFKQNGGK